MPTEGGPKRLKGKERARSDEGKEEPKPGAKTGLIKLKRCAPQSVRSVNDDYFVIRLNIPQEYNAYGCCLYARIKRN